MTTTSASPHASGPDGKAPDTIVRYGLTLSSEEHPPERLVELAVEAEGWGFDFASISDHYHPWLDDQGHAGFVWSVLGAIAARTERLAVGVGVSCPTIRIHPAILAQAVATTGRLFGGRLTWGVGTGENLNEHITGQRWPPADLRLEMLEEAVDVVRSLLNGTTHTSRGRFYTVENARIYDVPDKPVPIVVSAFGTRASALAARIGDGLWMSTPVASTVEHWRASGGSGPVYAQITCCVADDEHEARRIAHRYWRTSGVPGQLSQDLATPALFDQAASAVTVDQMSDLVPCGPDPRPILEQAAEARAMGVDHIYFHQIGPHQQPFFSLWESVLRPTLLESDTLSGDTTVVDPAIT